MHKYFYQICTIPANNKHLVRKIIYNQKGDYIKHEDNKFTPVQLNKLLKVIDINEYSNIEGNTIESLLTEISDTHYESQNLNNFITGNFSYP